MGKHALVVGVSRYEDPEITDLPFAAGDAVAMERCLRDVCGFDEVRTLVTGGEREPDHVGVVDALHNLAPLLTAEDTLLLYFAGHGIHMDGKTWLLTSNSRIHMPQLASISMEVLRDCLSVMESTQRVLILDACRNDPRKGMGDADNLLTEAFSRDIVAVARTPAEGVIPSTCLLFSCSEGERAYEWADRGHGAFTYYLLEGLRGAAADPGGLLTAQGLGRYVEEKVPRWSHKMRLPRPQRPWGEQFGAFREIVLSSGVAATASASASPAPPPAPKAAERWREGGHAYDEAALGLYERVLSLPDWRLPDPERNRQGMLEAMHERTGLPFVLVPSGSFRMGSEESEKGHYGDEGPAHTVRVPALLLCRTQCTQRAWDRVGGEDLRYWRSSALPIEGVSWKDVKLWCGKAGLRLPSESQWEYACRAGSTSRWCFGERESLLEQYAWYRKNAEARTHAVAGKRPNAWGLFDMHGNVWEWCEDAWHSTYEGAPADGSAWTTGGSPDRVYRGGSWSNSARFCRSAYRRRDVPGGCRSLLGFRPAFSGL